MTQINARMTKDKKSLCKTLREVGINLIKPTPEEWARSRVAREAVRLYRLNPAVDINAVMAYIDAEMCNVPAISPITAESQKAQVKAMVERAISFDDRRWNDAYPKEFRFGGHSIKARPDFWIESEVEIGGKTYPFIEVNSLSAGAPLFGTTSRTGKGDNLYHNLVSCGDLLYGKALLNGREGIVRVSYDFLKTKADKGGDYSKPFSAATKADNFSKSGSDNRAWIEVWFSAKGAILDKDGQGRYNSRNPQLFKNYKVSLEAYLNGVCGEDMTKGTCEKCELYDRCKGYSKRPEPKPEQKSEKKVSIDDIEFSDEQRQVIDARYGIFAVDAGPGSGKSFSVCNRVANMIIDGEAPEGFLLCSFSKAAVEVLKKVIDFIVNEVYCLGIDISGMDIATFNSIGDSLVRRYYKELGFSKEPQLIDDIENIDIIRRAIDWSDPIEGFDYTNPLMRFGAGGVVPKLEKVFKDIRQFNWDKRKFFENYAGEAKDKVWAAYERYVAIMKAENYIDYADQSILVEGLIRRDPTLVTDMFDYEHIIVDEFQDSNDFQMLLINALVTAPSNLSLMVIGDEAQAIYGFRGCSPENLVEFDNKMGLGGVKDLTLTINRRSTPEIVALSNNVINLNPGSHKMMTSANPTGSLPRWKAFEKDSAELPWVADEIEKLVKSGVQPSDIAFISHRKSTLTKLQGLLSEREVLGLYDQPEEILSDSKVKAILSLADFLRDGESTKGVFDYLCEVYGNDFMSNPDAGKIVEWEADSLRKLLAIPSDDKSKKDLFLHLVKAIEDETDNLYKAFVSRIEGKTSYNSWQLLNYLYKFKKYESEEAADKGGEYEAVALVTAHSSKGKEWKYVFVSISDFDSGLLTHAEMPEKVRLVYVAVTRAREELTVTCSKYRRTEGDVKPINRFWRMFGGLEGFEDISAAPEDLAAHSSVS